jgi:hypothetical protein
MNEIALEAINRFCYESLNFESVWYDWRTYNRGIEGTYVPRFITECKWTCDTDHIVSKWLECVNTTKAPSDAFIIFYARLDSHNQDIMAEWIFNNGATGGGR